MPATVTPAIEAAMILIRRLYADYSSVDGNLPIVTDDWNVENTHLASCGEEVREVQEGRPSICADTHPPQVALEAEILSALDAMTEQERYTVLALETAFSEEPSRTPRLPMKSSWCLSTSPTSAACS